MSDTGVKQPIEPPRKWHRMAPGDFQRDGLLFFVNSTVLWPLGLALYVVKDTETDEFTDQMGVMAIDPPELIIDNDPNSENHPRYTASKWITERVAAMPDDEQTSARDLLTDPLNVAAFLMEHSDLDRLTPDD